MQNCTNDRLKTFYQIPFCLICQDTFEKASIHILPLHWLFEMKELFFPSNNNHPYIFEKHKVGNKIQWNQKSSIIYSRFKVIFWYWTNSINFFNLLWKFYWIACKIDYKYVTNSNIPMVSIMMGVHPIFMLVETVSKYTFTSIFADLNQKVLDLKFAFFCIWRFFITRQ